MGNADKGGLPTQLWHVQIGSFLLGADLECLAQAGGVWRERAVGMLQAQVAGHQTALYETRNEDERDEAWYDLGDLEFNLTELVANVLVEESSNTSTPPSMFSQWCALLDYLHWVRTTGEWPLFYKEMEYDEEYVHHWSPFICVRKPHQNRWLSPEVLYILESTLGQFEHDGMIGGLIEPMDVLPLEFFMESPDTLILNCYTDETSYLMHEDMARKSRVLLYGDKNSATTPGSVLVTTHKTLRQALEKIPGVRNNETNDTKAQIDERIEHALASPFLNPTEPESRVVVSGGSVVDSHLMAIISYRLGGSMSVLDKTVLAPLKAKYKESFPATVSKLMRALRQEYISLQENWHLSQQQEETERDNKKQNTSTTKLTPLDREGDSPHPLVQMYHKAFANDGLGWKALAVKSIEEY